jgi:lipopolysaccharide transport system permease protein
MWEYRELLSFLLWRDIKVRYKQTALGVAWAIVQPLTAMAIFTVVFGRFAHLPSAGVPYPLFTFAGLLMWTFIAAGTARASASLVTSSSLITKVYFPRMLVPIASSLIGIADFSVSFVLFLGLMTFYRVVPTARFLAAPVFALLMVLLTAGVGLWFAALNARYRDVGQVAPFLIQMWLYASPVGYSSQIVRPAWRLLYSLNPVVGIVEGFRWSMLGAAIDLSFVVPSALVTVVVLVSGLYYFRLRERTVADVI